MADSFHSMQVQNAFLGCLRSRVNNSALRNSYLSKKLNQAMVSCTLKMKCCCWQIKLTSIIACPHNYAGEAIKAVFFHITQR